MDDVLNDDEANDMDVKSLAVLAVPIHEDPVVQVGMMRQLATMPSKKQVWEQMMIHKYS